MGLNKYSKLTDYTQNLNLENLTITEKEGILYISGKASKDVKDKIWELYKEIDPEVRFGDLVLDIQIEEE